MTPDAPAIIKVDIWSDIACPWCYIGKRRFEAAVERFREAGGEVQIEYHSFQLAPDAPAEYEGSHVEYLAERKGIPVEVAQQLVERVTGVAASVGLAYDYDRMQQTNTRLAHELLHFAKTRGRQAETAEVLFRAQFVDGGHVGRIDDLVALAADAGLDPVDARAALESGEHRAAVDADIAQAAGLGITGVPFFVFDGQYGVSGAQETETFAAVLDKARELRAA